jgi:cysteinyl-tRNA synthetase
MGAVRLVQQKLAAAPAAGLVDPAVQDLATATTARFREAMDDDFNTAGALAALFDFSRETNTRLNAAELPNQATIAAMDEVYRALAGDVLGLLPADSAAGAGAELAAVTDQIVGVLIELRQEARKAKQWAQADAIRDRLKAIGVALEDGPQGTTWRLER